MLATPIISLLLLVPTLGLAVIGVFLSDAPAEWAVATLTAWAAIAAGLLAGAGLAGASGSLGWLAPTLGFAGLVVGGPPGLALAALALAAAAVPSPLLVPRWLPLAMSAVVAVAAVRRLL